MDSSNPWANLFSSGLRQVDLNLLAWKMWCNGCEQPLSMRNLVHDNGDILQLDLRCLWCNSIISVPLTFHKETGHNLLTTMDRDKENKDLVITNEDFSVDRPDAAFETKQAGERPEIKAAQGPKIEDYVYKVEIPTAWLKQARTRPRILRTVKTYSKNVIYDVCTIPMEDFNGDSLDREEILAGHAKLIKSSKKEVIKDDSLDKDEIPADHDKIKQSSKKEDIKDDSLDREEIMKSSKKEDFNTDSLVGEKISAVQEEIVENSEKPILESDDILPDWAIKAIINKDYQCGYCYQAFETGYNVRKHYVVEHLDFQKCVCWCKKKCKSRAALLLHMKKGHTPRMLCQYCGKGCLNKTMLNDHIERVHRVHKPVQCKLCSKMLRSKFSLKPHMKFVHAKMRFECDFCKKVISDKQKLIGHMSIHTNHFRFKCNICSAKFTRNCNLQNHIKNNHNYVCAVCSEHFLDFRSTKDHVLSTHTEEEVASTGVQFGVERITQFVCSVCNRCLATKQALQLHGKTHQATKKSSVPKS